MTITVGTQTQSTTFTVTPQSFPIAFVESKFGSVTVNTRPGIVCTLQVRLPNGQFLDDAAGTSPRLTNAQGNTAWIYTKPANTTGTGTHFAYCTSGGETPDASATFSAP